MTGPFAPLFAFPELTLGMLSQLLIGVFGISAVFVSQDPAPSRRRWAPVLGLCSQPFWFYSTITGGQWGIALLSCFYTLSWVRGFYHQWIRKPLEVRA